MTMPKMKALQPRERQLALIAGLVIGCYLVLTWVLGPLWGRVQDLREQVVQERDKLEAMSGFAERAGASDREYQAVAPLLGQGGTGDNALFLTTLETLAQNSGVRLNIAPRSTVSGEGWDRSNVELDAEGPQTQVISFLDAVLSMPALATVERMRVSMVPGKTDVLRASILVQHIQPQTP